MCKVERWAEKWPDDVLVLQVDDIACTSALLVLIEHKNETEYCGVTAVFIPQNGGGPSEFFMYPHALQQIRSALDKILS